MLKLQIKREPEWVDILNGAIRLHVAPLNSAMMMAVRSDLAGQDIADMSTEEAHVALVKAIARRTVLAWEGVGDAEGKPIEPSPEAVDALMDLHRVFGEFDAKIVGPYLLVQSEKNASAPLPSGTSAGAETTAQPASGSAKSAQPE